jgi:hypothetical protein
VFRVVEAATTAGIDANLCQRVVRRLTREGTIRPQDATTFIYVPHATVLDRALTQVRTNPLLLVYFVIFPPRLC